MRASLEGVKGYEQMRSHYWNLMENGSEVDLTAGQFREGDRSLVPDGSPDRDGAPITREGILAHEPTRNRYEILKERVNDEFKKKYQSEVEF